MKPFNNQFATQKLRQETSVTGTGATFTPGEGEQYAAKATKKVVRKKLQPEKKDVEPKLAAGKAKVYMKDKWGWEDAPSVPNRPSKGGFIYKQLFQELSDFISEANVPENIKKFAKKKGITNIVNQVARWAEKAGKRIVGGTAIGKNYSTLILDLTYNGSEVYINIDNETIEVNGEEVYSYDDFVKALGVQDMNEEIEPEDKIKIVDKESRFFGRIGKVHDIHDDNTAMIIVDAPGNPTTTVDIAKLKLIPEINESYSRFKNETKTRTKPEQFHQAVREVKRKVQEINKLFEYVSRLKEELSEGENGLKYKMHTEKALEKIKEMVSSLNQSIKKFK